MRPHTQTHTHYNRALTLKDVHCVCTCVHLMVYSRVPFSIMRKSLLGIVMLCATDFLPLWKKVSGVQILLAIRLLRRRMFIGPWNFRRSSVQRWRKNTSTVYSWGKRVGRQGLLEIWNGSDLAVILCVRNNSIYSGVPKYLITKNYKHIKDKKCPLSTFIQDAHCLCVNVWSRDLSLRATRK